jgi:hypothetical protein
VLRPESLRRWCAFVGAALLLCVAVAGTGARASVLSMQEVRATTASTGDAAGMPMASGSMPCLLCCIAPASTPHAFTGEGKEPEPLTWWVHAEPPPAAVRFLTTVGRRDRVPIRVAFCRWLD